MQKRETRRNKKRRKAKAMRRSRTQYVIFYLDITKNVNIKSFFSVSKSPNTVWTIELVTLFAITANQR